VDSKYVVIFDRLQPGHVTAHAQCAIYGRLHMENAGLAYIGPLQANISVTVAVRKKVSTDHLGNHIPRKKGHVTDDVT